jgi:hypothetical protein
VTTIKAICLIYTLALTVLAAGCSSRTSTDKTNSAPVSHSAGSNDGTIQKFDACSLLTKADAESFLSEPVGAPATTHTEAMGNTVTQCRYSASSGNKRVGLLLRQAATAEEAAKIFRQARDTSKELSGAEPQVMDGLGEGAYWTGGNLKQLNVLKGEVWLIITASQGNGTDPLEACKTISRKILARMP